MRRPIALTLACAISLFATLDARADDKVACVMASEQGQNARDAGKYSQARDAFATCARDGCPPLVRHDCTGWLADLEQSWPSVVVVAKDDSGNDLVDVEVVLDGNTIAGQLDGKPLAVDPGQHVFRFISNGAPPVEQTVVIHTGEKSRVLKVDVHKNPPPPGTVPTPPPRTNPGDMTSAPTTNESHGPPAAAWIFGGLAIAGFGTEAYLGITGLQDLNSLKNSNCAVNASCPASQVQAIRMRFLAADIALGVGVVSTLLSAYFFLSSHGSEHEHTSTSFDFAPAPGGGEAVYGGRF